MLIALAVLSEKDVNSLVLDTKNPNYLWQNGHFCHKSLSQSRFKPWSPWPLPLLLHDTYFFSYLELSLLIDGNAKTYFLYLETLYHEMLSWPASFLSYHLMLKRRKTFWCRSIRTRVSKHHHGLSGWLKDSGASVISSAWSKLEFWITIPCTRSTSDRWLRLKEFFHGCGIARWVTLLVLSYYLKIEERQNA